MTADAFSEDVKKCLACGMDAHLAKPIDPALLEQTIGEVMRKGRNDAARKTKSRPEKPADLK